VVRPQAAPQLLTTRAEKLELLGQLGVDAVVLIAFDQHLASYAPDEFVREILVGRLGARHLVIGYDHGFGRGRSGDATTLRALGAREGFTVDVVEPVIIAGAPVSSSHIRRALSNGDLADAAVGLGRPYSLRGRVVRGDGRGSTLGFPTANLALPDPIKLVPLEGIYAVRADIGGELLDGVLHLGPRPTYAGAAATIELHLFDFHEDIYGKDVGVRFCTRLRGVERFTGSAQLSAAIAADCAAARRVLSEDGGACGHGTSWLALKAV
jgi:riboflavin kinase/FMN adenylyltransferase